MGAKPSRDGGRDKQGNNGKVRDRKLAKLKAEEARRMAEEKLNNFFSILSIDLDSVSCAEPAKAFAVARLRDRMRKRAEFYRPHLRKEAIDNFKRVNAQVGFFDASALDPNVLAEARAFIFHVLNKYARKLDPNATPDVCFNRLFIEENWRYGPKASNGVSGTGVVQKLPQGLSCTSRAEPYVRRIRMSNLYLALADARAPGTGCKLMLGSKITTVLKNEDTERTIATEPPGNMAIQLAGGLFVERALMHVGLNIHTQQPKNKRLAQRGSLDGSLATEDLKSASDMGARQMIARTWPDEWVRFFEDARSPVAQAADGSEIHLNMLSTMGNGFTFPVMTLTILALIYAVRRLRGGPKLWIDWNVTAVYGDDIIIPVEEHAEVCRALENFGYVVNHDKSFASGPFRESCGGDYYLGVDVTPFYVRSLSKASEVYVAINQVLSWASAHELPLTRSLGYLRSLLNGKIYKVPGWMQPYSGVQTSQCPRNYKYLATVPADMEFDAHDGPNYEPNVFTMMLVCGGYLSQWANGEFHYCPSEDWVRYETREAWLPRGYQDGWSPDLGGFRQSTYRDILLSILNL